jgi:hypothetical protein
MCGQDYGRPDEHSGAHDQADHVDDGHDHPDQQVGVVLLPKTD